MINLGLIGSGLVSQICHLPSFVEDKRVNFVPKHWEKIYNYCNDPITH